MVQMVSHWHLSSFPAYSVWNMLWINNTGTSPPLVLQVCPVCFTSAPYLYFFDQPMTLYVSY